MTASAPGSAFTATPPLRIDVWSDIMCPFCYLGDAALDRALAEFAHSDRVSIRYHSYQLMPELGETPVDLDKIFREQRGMPPEQIAASQQQIAERGATLGLTYRFEDALTVNTRTAHRLAHFAESRGIGHAMILRLFRAYFADGLNVADHETLIALATDLGLDRDEVADVLRSDAYDAEVTADIEQARTLGISGVPFFVFDGKYAVSGAQPVEVFTQALETAWQNRETPRETP